MVHQNLIQRIEPKLICKSASEEYSKKESQDLQQAKHCREAVISLVLDGLNHFTEQQLRKHLPILLDGATSLICVQVNMLDKIWLNY